MVFIADSAIGGDPFERDTVQEIIDLLGRKPQGDAKVVLRYRTDGRAAVLQNYPLFYDGTPMPTLYWLVDRELVRSVSRLESEGVIRLMRGMVDQDELATSHRAYANARDSLLPSDYSGVRPHGGVGGTDRGIKCLHAHLAWYLVGWDDPVGVMVAETVGISRDKFVNYEGW